MTASIEDRIVALKMENTQFEKGVNQSLASLTKLENALNKGISAKGLDDVKNSVGRFNLNPMEHALAGISKSWLAMSTIAVTALATVTNKVISTGSQMVKSLTLDPILQGFNEYSTNLTAIQTVLANTQAQGTTLDDVNLALKQLNDYSDKTIYNFGEMAKNIGTFTAAGVSLEGSVESIKGIANLAALSGSSSEQASTAMYQLSQAIAAGRVSLQDWNSVVNAGMGGSTFQRALAQTAQAMGTIEASAIKIDEETGKMTINGASFRDSISAIGGEKWLTSDVLTNTLAQFTGDLTDAELAAQGFNAAQIKAIQQTAKTAQDAATKVKTIKQVFDVAKETIGSGWAQTFQRIFGDFEQARSTMTKLSGFIGEIINRNADARNAVLDDWAKLNGRTIMIRAIRHAWEALMSVVGPIKDAFREIFPAKTGQDLVDITRALNRFFKAITLTESAQENLKDTFAGFFAVIHIGYSILKGVLSIFGTLLGLFLRGQGSTLAFTGGIGQMLVALDKFLTGGERMEKFFAAINDALTFILEPLFKVRDGLIGAFSGLVTGNPQAFFDGISSAVEHLLGLVDDLSQKFADVVNTISDSMGGLGSISGFNLAGMFGGFGSPGSPDPSGTIDKIKAGVEGIEGPSNRIRDIWEGIKRVFGAIGDFFAPLIDQFKRAGGALTDAFSNVFSGAASSLDFSEFLDAVNTGLFLAIFLTFRKFSNAITGIADSASGVLDQVTSNLKTMQNQVRADMIFKIAASLVLLSGAVFLLAQTDPKSLGVALGAVVAMLGALVGAMVILEKQTTGLFGGGKLTLVAGGLILMAGAVAAMAAAVFLFGKMDPETLKKGLIGVSSALAALTASAFILTKSGAGANMVGAATGLLIMSAALLALSGAVLIYSRIDTGTLLEGLLKAGAAIAVLAVAMSLMKTGVGGAAAMFVAAAALIVMAKALKKFGDMDTSTIAKGLIAMGGALAILVVGMNALQTGLLGAAALVVIAFGLKMLVPVLQQLGDMDTSTIIKGLLALIGVIVALTATAVLLAPVIPVLTGLAVALALIGAAVLGVGAGVALFAGGLALLAQNGTEGFGVLKEIIMDFLEFLPEMVLAFGDTISAIAQLIGEKAPELNAAFAKLMSGMIDSAIMLMPKFGKLISAMIKTGLKVLVSYYSDLTQAGMDLIMNLLDGLEKNIPKIAGKATDVAIAFVNAIGDNAVKFANAAADALIDFLDGITAAIQTKGPEIRTAGSNVAKALIAQIIAPVQDAGQAILDALISAWNWAKDHFNPGKIDFPGVDIPLVRGNVYNAMVSELGLVGGSDQVKEAMQNMEATIQKELDKSNRIIDRNKAKLEKLRKQGKGDSKEAKKLEAELKAQRDRRKELMDEQKKWDKKMKEERAELRRLAKQYDELQANIAAAKDALEEAQKDRDDFIASTTEQFDQKPDISAGMSFQSYMRQIQQKTAQVKKFMETLQALRAAGLSDASYEQLLAEGVDAQKLMEQMLAGGGDAIAAFNAANAAMTETASSLASTASTSLYYDAAVASAQATLDGWEDQLPALEAQMTKVAKIMIRAIKKALGIKSPSREFREVADYTTEGFVGGLTAGITKVEKASERVGMASLEALQMTMNKASSMGVLDMSPTITPVLDLTRLQEDATKIGSMLATEPLVANVSYEKAASISADQQAALEALDFDIQGGGDTIVDFTQINNSPKALSPIDSYRNTKSAIPLIKEALDV